ncbi:MAG: peptide ABC transporter substrate-binding protein [bacterium]|nr:peptide ABC transporter substrate-binding protein [bacterium]
MKFLKSYQSKIGWLELRLRYVVKTLSPRAKIVFVAFSAVTLIGLLALLYKADKSLAVEIPAQGGILKEGIVGTPRFINPILAISDADRDLTALVYSGLMRVSENNQLAPDLAESYEISNDGLCYTFTLKPNLKWSDGKPLNTDDVIFTIDLIKNNQTKSPKRASWEGVLVEKLDEKKVQFCLQKIYAPFLENTTIGIMPKHIWKDLPIEQLSLSDFNIKPIGSGPYKIQSISKNSSGITTSYTLNANKNFALHQPYIETMILKFYPSENKLIDGYKRNEIDSLSAVSPKNVADIKKEESVLKTYFLPRVFGVFFNQDNAKIFTDKEVKRALDLGVDKELIIKEVLKGFGAELNGPLPPTTREIVEEKEKNYEKNLAQAKNILEKAGWKMNNEGTREKTTLTKNKKKETVKLEFSLSTSNVEELSQTAQLLKEMWGKLGAKVDVRVYEIGDLEQNVIRPRKYNALLFGESMARDPDPFAFWHSSQRNDPGLNIALYTNISVDKILEDARAIFDQNKREEKYKQFQKEINKDAAAIFLYSPDFIYLLPNYVKSINGDRIVMPSDRFVNVHNWYIETKKTWKLSDNI